MTKLQRGKLYISKEDIKSTLGLTEDTIISPVVTEDGVIELDVIASSENKQDWLTENNGNQWNMKRKKIYISVDGETKGYVTGGVFTGSINGLSMLHEGEKILPKEGLTQKLNDNVYISIHTEINDKGEVESILKQFKKGLGNKNLK